MTPAKLDEDAGSPEAVVTGCCKLLGVGSGNSAYVCWKSSKHSQPRGHHLNLLLILFLFWIWVMPRLCLNSWDPVILLPQLPVVLVL